MINLALETVISLSEAAKRLPARRGGKKPHVATLYRWSLRGCRGVVLETCQVGGTRCTSLEALQRFVEQLSASRTAPFVPSFSTTMDRGKQDLEKMLDAEGL